VYSVIAEDGEVVKDVSEASVVKVGASTGPPVARSGQSEGQAVQAEGQAGTVAQGSAPADALLGPLAFDIGDAVTANYKLKGKWLPGAIVKVSLGEGPPQPVVYHVLYTNGALERTGADCIKLVSRGSRLAVGDAVEGNYKGRGKWYPAKIAKVVRAGMYNLDYDDGETEASVEQARVRPKGTGSSSASLVQVGMRVSAQYRGKGLWLPGELARITGDGADTTYTVLYDDSDVDLDLPGACVRTLEGVPLSALRVTLSEGVKVEGNFRGRGKWYPGVIKRVC
jgi:hypothetical protein